MLLRVRISFDSAHDSRLANQGRPRGELRSLREKAEFPPNQHRRGKTARSICTDTITSGSHRSHRSLSDEPYSSSISDPKLLKALTQMPRLYDMDGVHYFNERYGSDLWYQSDGYYDGEDEFDSDDESDSDDGDDSDGGDDGDGSDIDSRTIRRSGQGTWSFSGPLNLQITQT